MLQRLGENRLKTCSHGTQIEKKKSDSLFFANECTMTELGLKNTNRIDRTDADCVECLLRYLKRYIQHHPDIFVDEIRQSQDLYDFLIDFLSERVDAQNALAHWKLGEELETKKLVDAAVSCVQVHQTVVSEMKHQYHDRLIPFEQANLPFFVATSDSIWSLEYRQV